MLTRKKTLNENPFADNAKAFKSDPFAGLCKACNKAGEVILALATVILATALIAAFLTFLTEVGLRVIHPESEYKISTSQIWIFFWITLIILFCLLATQIKERREP